MPISEVLIALNGGVPKGSLVKVVHPHRDILSLHNERVEVVGSGVDRIYTGIGYLFFDEIEVLRWGPEEATCDQP